VRSKAQLLSVGISSRSHQLSETQKLLGLIAVSNLIKQQRRSRETRALKRDGTLLLVLLQPLLPLSLQLVLVLLLISVSYFSERPRLMRNARESCMLVFKPRKRRSYSYRKSNAKRRNIEIILMIREKSNLKQK
jgi:hypothetical protein